MGMVDIMNVKAAVKSGRLKTDIMNGEIILRDMQTEEAAKIGDVPSVDGKTADEMFRDLGFPHSHKWKGVDLFYSKDKAELIQVSKDIIRKYSYCGTLMSMTAAEIRAVCKLLDEMGVE